MQQPRRFWFVLNVYGWAVLLMSIVSAAIIGQAWVVLLGVIGYLLALLVDLVGGGSLGRTGMVRLGRVEQENRELRAEQARLLGAIREREARLAGKASPPVPAAAKNPDPAPDPDQQSSG